MQRFHREHPIYDELSVFDTNTGQLTTLGPEELPARLAGAAAAGDTVEGIRRLDGGGRSLFSGPCSASHTRFPRRIYFQITRRCNLSCDYCFLRAGRHQAHVPAPAAKRMAQFLGRNGLMEVRLTGGEPTTHPDFFAILEAFRQSQVYVSVATNGTMPPSVVERLADRDHLWVIVSLDGPRAVHEHHRPGTFDTIVSRMKLLKRLNPRVRLRLTSVLTRLNMHHIRALCQLTGELQAESLTVIPLRPQVRSAAVMDEMITAREFRGVLEEMVRAHQELGVKVSTTIETDHASQIHHDPVVRKRTACAAGREATNLDYDAATERFLVYGCSYSPAPDLTAPAAVRAPFLAGTFAASDPEGLARIWGDDERWRIYRDLEFKPAECLDCSYLRDHRCVGSCPIQNVDYGRLDLDGDMLRQLREQITRTSEWYCYQRLDV